MNKIKSGRKLNMALCGILLLVIVLFTPGKVYALDQTYIDSITVANQALSDITANKYILGSLYMSDEIDVMSEADYYSDLVMTALSGQTVMILGQYVNDDYELWTKVFFYCGNGEYTGYVPRESIATSDEDFLAWEENYNMSKEYWDGVKASQSPRMRFRMFAVSPQADGRTYSDDVKAFPESYWDALQDLKDAHPNWTFVKMNTGLDFQTVINNELGDKSWVSNSFPDSYKNGAVATGWSYASEGILKFYIDTRNSLTEDRIFQFEQLTYNASYHNKGTLVNFLNTTFMSDTADAPGTPGKKYSDIIWSAATNTGLSPFHLASRIYQEQGSASSPMISGTQAGYEGLYNHFNIGASGKTNSEVIANGLTKARNEGWTDSEKSVLGGARFIGTGYVLRGQDTLYLQKFNVNPQASNAVYTHQYMQNIMAPTTESQTTMKMYKNAGSLDSAFVFKIPVFNNMPAYACERPGATTKVDLVLPSSASSNGVSSTPSVWIDGIEKTSVQSNGCITVDTGNQTSKTAVIYKYDSNGICRGMYVWMLEFVNGYYVATYESGLEDLLTYQGFSIRVSGQSGIRFKTGIDTSLRATLLSSGVDGYKITEYGTVAMAEANRASYPFIKGGEKTTYGVAYGYNASGQFVDAIFETVGGKDKFTSVLTNLAVDKYKADVAFRGYIILNNGARSVTLYGPPVSNNIYALAQRLISMNYYEAGSAQDLYIRKIVADADALGGE